MRITGLKSKIAKAPHKIRERGDVIQKDILTCNFKWPGLIEPTKNKHE